MIVSVDKLKKHITTTLDDEVLEDKLRALELSVRAYTNNNFQIKGARSKGEITGGQLRVIHPAFKVADTVQISETDYNNGVYSITGIENGVISLEEALIDEPHALVTLVKYPEDVQQGVINLMKWDLENRSKVGISSETISRHSVTYFNMDGENSTMGFPKSLLGFLKPYRKARF